MSSLHSISGMKLCLGTNILLLLRILTHILLRIYIHLRAPEYFYTYLHAHPITPAYALTHLLTLSQTYAHISTPQNKPKSKLQTDDEPSFRLDFFRSSLTMTTIEGSGLTVRICLCLKTFFSLSQPCLTWYDIVLYSSL